MILEDKVVVISGVGAGLGKQIARAALRDGAKVFLGARTAETLRQVSAELDPDGERVGWRNLDITDGERCKKFAAAAEQRFGRVDALVNCAAHDTLFGGLMDSAPEDWKVAFDTNFDGSLRLTRELVPALETAGGGSVVFIGAQAMYRPQTPQLGYAASKAALSTAALYLADELGPRRIRVNTVVPTWMWGAPVEGYVEGQAQAQGVSKDEIVAGITANMALDEIPGEADVAEAAVFLSSDRARMITGQSLLVNAGELYR